MNTTTVPVPVPVAGPVAVRAASTPRPGVVLTGRDRAILAALAGGRCAIGAGAGAGAPLLIDGLRCSDQFASTRLRAAGLLHIAPATGTQQLTATLTLAGRHALLGLAGTTDTAGPRPTAPTAA